MTPLGILTSPAELALAAELIDEDLHPYGSSKGNALL
jgi:hypothetical protein